MKQRRRYAGSYVVRMTHHTSSLATHSTYSLTVVMTAIAWYDRLNNDSIQSKCSPQPWFH
ncbi:hypothetical protein DL93DRAFT_218216 [Clavulina sp. PMI_390]|nr:hypothetical protein DL93DRAFT_218216 [Clavulina sp. PMI_390]